MAEKTHSAEQSPQSQFENIKTSLAKAADAFWHERQNPEVTGNSFIYGYSAAADNLAVIFAGDTEERETDDYAVVIALGEPTRRMRSALAEYFPDMPAGNRLIFGLSWPGLNPNKEVEFTVRQRANLDEPLFSSPMNYDSFFELMQAGGICERIAIHRRIGRWVARQAIKYLEIQTGLAELEKPIDGNNYGL